MNKVPKLCVCVFSCVFALHAAERVWTGTDGANWTDLNVWATNGIPSSAPENADTVTITNGLVVNLTSPALDDTNRFALVQLSGNQRGTLMIGPSGYLPTVGLNISQSGTNPNTPGRVVVDGGRVHATGVQNIGTDNVNNPGRLEILNGANYTSTAAFRIYGGSVLVSNASFNASFTSYIHGSSLTNVFENVDGTVNMTAFAIGRDVGNAAGKACRNVLRMRSGLLRTTGDLEVGHTGLGNLIITGAVEQTGGTVLSASGNVRLPINASAVGEYLLDGGLLSIQNTSDSFFLGGRDGAAKGFFKMTDGAFTNRGVTQVGSYSRGYGSVAISGGSAVFEKGLLVGAITNSSGELTLSGGTLTLTTSAANLLLGNASNATGRCTVNDGLLYAPGRTLQIGSAASGTGLFVQNGGLVTNSTTYVGTASTANGTLILSNGTLGVAGNLIVGNTNNTGRFEMNGGTLLLSGSAVLGANAYGIGTFVLNSGVVSNTGFSVGNVLSATGGVDITGGQIYSSGEFHMGNGVAGKGGFATFSMSGGQLLVTQRWIVGSYGTAYASLSGGEIEALRPNDQCLEVGRDPGPFGRLEMTGGALKGPNELVLARDPGSTGLVYVAGGDLYVQSIRRANGLHSLYLAGGTLHPYNKDANFAFSAALTNDIGYGDTATRFGLSALDKDGVVRTVSALCTFTGNGGLAKRDTGTVKLSGTLTYSGATVVEEGTLALSNTVASLASDLIDVHSGATLDVSVNRILPFSIVNGQTLGGEGTVKGPVHLSTGATLSGGTPSVPSVLTLDGDLTLDTDSTVLFNMLSGNYSRVHVTGNLNLPATARLMVNGAATTDAEGRAFLTWGGTLSMPGKTLWTVDGEKDPLVVVNHGTKSLTLSYRRGSLFSVR